MRHLNIFTLLTFLTVISLEAATVKPLPLINLQRQRSEIYNLKEGFSQLPSDLDFLLEETADSVAVDPFELEIMELTLDSLYLFSSLQPYNFRPVVFDSYMLLDTIPLLHGEAAEQAMLNIAPFKSRVFDTNAFSSDLIRRAKQDYFINNPGLVIYDESKLPEPPKKFISHVDPETAKIVIDEVKIGEIDMPVEAVFDKRHWLHTFNGEIQFSQAYVSPNWYQGGNNNLNTLINAYYNVKLNPAFHPKWLFETTLQYKLSLNNAPDDELRTYNISEDLFQFNLLFGHKASKNWYYSTNAVFKTQFLNNYKPNTNDLSGAFLSPGELNVGIGMTYNRQNPAKTFAIDVSIAPLAWNMKTCINRRMNVTAYGIKEGHKVVNEIGSSAEVKINWTVCKNVNIRSRFFAFTDYSHAYADWENTFSFTINRFLSTQIYLNMRYDTSTPKVEDSKWSKLQLKEILSFGFAYKFSTK